MMSTNDQQAMISSFLEVAVGQSAETARQFLQATGGKLDEAILLFFVDNNSGGMASELQAPESGDADVIPAEDHIVDGLGDGFGNNTAGHGDEDGVGAPLPVRREVLYDDAILFQESQMGYPANAWESLVAFDTFGEGPRRLGIWESEQGATPNAEDSRDTLASLYRPPFHLMFRGSFQKVKGAASMQDKWLLVNLQSTKEFSSHMLNRDTWANEAVSQTISSNFIFWQVYDDTTEGQKVRTYYRVDSIPVVLIIDPITGQQMRSLVGMVQPEDLLEVLISFMDGSPKDHHLTLTHKRPRARSLTTPQKCADVSKEEDENTKAASAAASLEDVKDSAIETGKEDGTAEEEEISTSSKREFPPLPDEPKVERSLLCQVAVRLPDGRRAQRSFLRTDPVQLLWSFCYLQLGNEDRNRPFRLVQAIPGASKLLDYNTKLTFDESDLANSVISLTWE